MVDTKDLKSFGHSGCAGSSPAPSTTNPRNLLKINNLRGFLISLRANCVQILKFFFYKNFLDWDFIGVHFYLKTFIGIVTYTSGIFGIYIDKTMRRLRSLTFSQILLAYIYL